MLNDEDLKKAKGFVLNQHNYTTANAIAALAAAKVLTTEDALRVMGAEFAEVEVPKVENEVEVL